jgi:hypothetical protein
MAQKALRRATRANTRSPYRGGSSKAGSPLQIVPPVGLFGCQTGGGTVLPKISFDSTGPTTLETFSSRSGRSDRDAVSERLE